MSGYHFSKREIEPVYDEVIRRLKQDIAYCNISTPKEIHELKSEMMQGVYGTLMILSGEHWPMVASYSDRIEDEIDFWNDFDEYEEESND